MASHYYDWTHGRVHYVKRGMGEPIVLVHNLYLGAGHEEFEHNLDELARHFTVYAIDLIGFGDSDAPRMRYTANAYVTLLHDFLKAVVGADGPAHVVAAGLSCAYVAEVAAWRPGLVRSITMICPRSEPTGLDLPRWVAPVRRFMIGSPALGGGFYDTMSNPCELRAFLATCFAGPKHVTQAKVDRLAYNASRPGGARPYASLVTGSLDSHLLKTLPHVDAPVLLLWGRQARPTPVEHSVRLNALLRRGRLEVVENAGAWVHDEQSAIVNRLICSFAQGRDRDRAIETA